jgi:hypothetical protein
MTTSKSQRFIILEQELRNLKENFLPPQFSLTGDYSEREIALAVAYRVLAHAEIESYLEDRVLEIAQNALTFWNDDKKTTVTLVFLFAFSGLTLDKPPDSLNPVQRSQNLDDKVKFDNKLGKVFNSFRTAVKDNHGIREKNILLLLLPIGIDSEDLDRIWLQEIDDFGKKRGEFAHQSASNYKTRQPPDPKNELEMVNRLLQGLTHLDRLLNDLLKR